MAHGQGCSGRLQLLPGGSQPLVSIVMLILTVDDHGDHRGHTHIPICLILIVT